MMKCFLLLLAFKLVSADKLDRTYLPPPGATFSGGSYDDLQTPLEYPKKSYNIMHNGQFPVASPQSSSTGHQDKSDTVDYPTLNYPSDIGRGTSYLPQSYDSTVPASTPSYDSFPPSTTYIDNSLSKSPIVAEPVYFLPTTNRRIGTSSDNLTEEDDSGYYYYVPKLSKHKSKSPNDKVTDIDNYNTLKSRFDLNSRQRNQNVTPKTVTTNIPSAFGYYGGNPMIMTSQKEISNMDVPLKFGEYNGLNLEMRSFYPERNGKGTVRPFQTPLVGNSKNQKPEDYKDSKPLVSSLSSQNWRTGNLKLKNNMPVELQQRSGVPIKHNFSFNEQHVESDKNAVILKSKNTITPEGYSYAYDTSNGIHAEESGIATDGVRARGSYSYTGDDGKVYSITYTADENGFQPRGDHLPTPPPIPEAIKKVIEQAARDKAAGIVHDGSYNDDIYGYKNYEGAMDRYRPKKIGISKGGQKNSAQVTYNNEALTRPSLNLRNDNQKIDNIQAKKNNGIINKSQQVEQTKTNKYLPYQEPVQNGLLSDNDNLNNKKTVGQSSRLPVVRINDLSNGAPAEEKILPKSMLLIKGNISQKDLEPDMNHQNNVRFSNPTAGNTHKSMTTQNPDIKYVSENVLHKDHKKSNQRLPSMIPTNNNNGYFYVPPIVHFQDGKPQLNDQSISNIKPDFQTGVLKSQDRNSIKRPESDNILEQNNIATNNLALIEDSKHQNDSLKMVPIFVTSQQEKLPYYDIPNDSQRPFEKDVNVRINYPNEFDSSYSTTPMQPSYHNHENHPIEGHLHQHYETTLNPADFHQTLPNIDNKFNIPSGNPRISISQDVVTSTHRPDSNGINLEINQNVKIHGVGSSTPVDFQGYPITTTGNEFYSTNIPEEETGFNENYFGNRLGKPAQNYGSTQDVGEFNIYTTKDPISAFDFGSTVSYNTPNFEKTDAIAFDAPNSSSITSKEFEQSLTPEDLSRTPTSVEGHYESGKVTGEDFSGPKQPQTFDPETGYHYK